METQKKKTPGFFSRIRGMDLTSGNLFWKLGLFALPMALTTVLQLLYTTVDLVSVHLWTGSENAASAISGNGSLINLVVVAFNGMAVGVNVAIGNAVGAKNREHANKLLHTALIFALLCGIAVGAFGFFMTPTLLQWVKIGDIYLEDATTYLRIYFLGLPALMLYNYGAQIHRAIGDSATPFLVLLISGLFNVLFDFLFVHRSILNMGVAGVGIATVIAETVSALLIVMSLRIHKHAFVCLKWEQLKVDRDCLVEIVKLGLPAGLQGFFFALPNTFIQSALYQIGADNVPLQNGAVAANNINNYNYAFIEALSSATMAIVAQNYGALKKDNIKKAFWYGMLWTTIYCSLYDVLIATAYHPLLSLFVDYDNDVAIEAGKQRLWLVGFTYVLDGYMDIASGAMKGVRHPGAPAIITAITCSLFRIGYIEALVLRVDALRTVLWLYAAYPFSWILADAADFPSLALLLRKEFKKMDALKEQQAKAAEGGQEARQGD